MPKPLSQSQDCALGLSPGLPWVLLEAAKYSQEKRAEWDRFQAASRPRCCFTALITAVVCAGIFEAILFTRGQTT